MLIKCNIPPPQHDELTPQYHDTKCHPLVSKRHKHHPPGKRQMQLPNPKIITMHSLIIPFMRGKGLHSSILEGQE